MPLLPIAKWSTVLSGDAPHAHALCEMRLVPPAQAGGSAIGRPQPVAPKKKHRCVALAHEYMDVFGCIEGDSFQALTPSVIVPITLICSL